MDTLKEFLIPKSFNRLSFLVIILWVVTKVILLGIFADIETNELSYFRCITEGEKKDYNQGLCFDDYQTKYTREFPLYGFILLDFFLVAIVCLIYSQFVKTRVQDIESDDSEMQRSQTSRRLYFSYCIQLAGRLLLGILFLILQWGVLYPVNFPSEYGCDLSSSVQQVNFINITRTPRNVTESLLNCHNQQASKKTFWSIILFVINVVFAILILVEMIYVLNKGKKDSAFKKDFNFSSIHLLNRDNTVKAYVNKLKERIKQNIREYEPLLPNVPGEETKLLKFDEIYTNLIMYPGRAEYEFDKERHEIIEGYLKSQKKYESINKIEGIFESNKNNPNEVPLNIMIIGRPGIGKTLLCQKILHDWASDKMFSDETEAGKRFETVYLFRFGNYNSDEPNKLSLKQWLDKCEFTGTQIPDKVFRNPEKVLVIFDGLDDFGHKSNIAKEETFANNPVDEIPFSALYAKLALGKLLKGATIVTTSRPTALSCVANIKFDKTIEILGFNSNQIEEYVRKFFHQNERAKQKVWNRISTNANLLSLCYIPVNCHIVCFSFQERLLKREQEESYLPLTLTEIFEDALMLILYKHNPEYKQPKVSEQEELLSSSKFTPKIDDSLTFLGELAYKGIESNRLIFESNEVEGHEECGLLHRLEDKKQKAGRKAQYCFVHLTMQEFLAARYIVAAKKDVEDFQNWVSKNIGEGKWQIVMQFVAGLLHGEDQSKTKIFTDILATTTFQGMGTTVRPRKEDKALVLMLFKCIFEMSRSSNNEWKNLVKVGQVETVDFSFSRITDADMAAIVYVLQEIESIPHTVNLENNYIGIPSCLEICKLLTATKPTGQDIFQHNRKFNLTTLNIGRNAIGDDGLKHLSDALSKDECKLTTLNIGRNAIGDDGLKHLSDVLSKDECKLTTLNISHNNIGDDGLKHLSDALSKDECKLTTLNISGNEIGDDGLKHLSDALSKDECKLTTLNISGNEIGDDGLKHLSDALSKDECKLTTLNIGFNKIGDDGLEYFQSNVLSKPECKLTEVEIDPQWYITR